MDLEQLEKAIDNKFDERNELENKIEETDAEIDNLEITREMILKKKYLKGAGVGSIIQVQHTFKYVVDEIVGCYELMCTSLDTAELTETIDTRKRYIEVLAHRHHITGELI